MTNASNTNRDNMIADYKRGDAVRAIAKRYDCSVSCVGYHLRHTGAGAEIRRARRHAFVGNVTRLREQGMTAKEIAKTLNYSVSSIHNLPAKFIKKDSA